MLVEGFVVVVLGQRGGHGWGPIDGRVGVSGPRNGIGVATGGTGRANREARSQEEHDEDTDGSGRPTHRSPIGTLP